jgi:pimeloyl-ACP methyl ester carboxylesterase
MILLYLAMQDGARRGTGGERIIKYMKSSPHILRTRIKREIVSEFLPPAATSSSSNKVIILCGGMPSYPGGKSEVAKFLSQKGYWVFIPRYRGSWESEGSFLRHSPEKDVIDVIDQLSIGFRDLWSRKIYKIARPEVYLVGASFGGAAVILASRDKRVRKAVAFSPVTDWRAETKTEPINKLRAFASEAFGNGYRFAEKDWNKLKTGTFYNPAHEADSIDGSKLLIIHAKDDKVVYAKSSVDFSKKVGARLVLVPTGGHFSISNVALPKWWKEIEKFFR